VFFIIINGMRVIVKGDFIAEYTGEIISITEFKRRWQLKTESQDQQFYFLSLDNHRIIDAGPAGCFVFNVHSMFFAFQVPWHASLITVVNRIVTQQHGKLVMIYASVYLQPKLLKLVS
jgi:hypothetical protein